MSAFTDGLRAAAQWLDEHPEAGEPFSVLLNVFPRGTAVVRHLGGFRKCDELVNWFSLRRNFGGEVILDFTWNREAVCERIVLGTKSVPEQITPAHDEEIVEWRCRPLLGHEVEPEGEPVRVEVHEGRYGEVPF